MNELYEAATAADDAYQAALVAAYKGAAGDMRYQPAKQTPAVKLLGDQYKAAMAAYHAAKEAL